LAAFAAEPLPARGVALKACRDAALAPGALVRDGRARREGRKESRREVVPVGRVPRPNARTLERKRCACLARAPVAPVALAAVRATHGVLGVRGL
jgi:hypothetical protein